MPSPLFHPDSPMDVSRVVAVYETLRERGPSGDPRPARVCSRVRDMLDGLEALLLDGYGVLNTGAEAVPNAAALIGGAAAAGIPVLVLTNGASRPSPVTAARYRGLGLDVGDGQVVSSRDAMLDGMTGLPGPIGVVDGAVELPGGDDRFVPLDPSRPGGWREVADIAFFGSIGWGPRWQECLEGAIAAGVPLHVANPDVAAPQEGGFSLEPGFWVAAALDAHPEAVVHWYGKPHGPAFDLAFGRIGDVTGRKDLRRDRMAMVGDTLHTDILGANAAGLKSILVTGHGLFRDGGADEAMEITGIRPDCLAAGL